MKLCVCVTERPDPFLPFSSITGIVSGIGAGMDPNASNGFNSAPAPVVSTPDQTPSPVTVPLPPTITASNTDEEAAQAAADGGFVLYPNMSNTNQLQNVYSKH